MAFPSISLWEKETYFRHRDIIIVGSGLVGLFSAYYLKKKYPRLSILVVDGGLIPSGASTRNAGFACFGSITELLADAAVMGEEKMLELVALRYKGLERIEKIFSKKEIALNQWGGYELIVNNQYPSSQLLQEHIQHINHLLHSTIGKKEVFQLANKKIKKFGFSGTAHLIENRLESQLHAGRLLEVLLQKVHQIGVQIITSLTIHHIESDNGKVRLTTHLPFPLHADQVLICTNGCSRHLLPDIEVSAARGQVLVTSPIKNLPFKGSFHCKEGYYYFRNVGNRILLGGARHLAAAEEASEEMITTDFIQKELERFLTSVVMTHQAYTIEHRWSGIMGIGSSKAPVVQQVKENIYCAVRMSGIGVAIAPMVGEQVAKMMRGAR
jgi:gamma-glutamylputrescine oxidase